MAVFKRKGYTGPNDPFYFKFDYPGPDDPCYYHFKINRLKKKQYFRCAHTTDEKTALKREAQFRAQVAREASLPPEQKPLPAAPTFGEYARLPVEHTFPDEEDDPGGRFWSEHATAAYSSEPNTLAFYRGRIKALLKFKKLADARLDQITPGLVQDLVVYFRGLKLQKSGINRNMSALRVVLNRAVNENLIRQGLTNYKPYKEVFKGQALNEEEEAIYLKHVTDPDHRDFFMILIDTAIEPGVTAALRWEDVGFDPVGKRHPRGFIHARGTKFETRDRNVPMSARLNLILKERRLRLGSPTRGFVFPPGQLDPEIHSTSVEAFRKKHERMWEGPKPVPLKYFRFYDLRHTALTRLVKTTGGNLFVLQKIAGWVDTQMAKRYIHLDEQTVSDAMDKFNDHLESSAHTN